MNTSIKNSNGQISAYGFACGYMENVDTQSLHKELYSEHGIYHVRSVRNNTPELTTFLDSGRTSHNYIIWVSFQSLTDARKLYNKIK